MLNQLFQSPAGEWLKHLFNLLFPLRCCHCREFSDVPICEKCREQIAYINEKQQLSGMPVHCIAAYEGVIKKAIWQLKFNKKIELQDLLQSIVSGNVPAEYKNYDYLVPVPLSYKRLKERGFNQAELLVSEVSSKSGKPVYNDLVTRNKNTKALFSLTETERQQEIDGAFAIKDSGSVKDKRILLFDDIITTGTTVTEIGNMLKQAGAREVYILGLAKTRKRISKK
ncbi:ComF family protein [Candidatus Margulisiibacteriota bacterium]